MVEKKKKGIILSKNQLPKCDCTQVGLISLHAQGMNKKVKQAWIPSIPINSSC